MEAKKTEKRGRPRIHQEWTAELLQVRAQEYFKKCDSRTKTIYTSDGAFEEANPIPYTVEGLCCYLKISSVTFRNWRKRDDELGDKAQCLHQTISANRIEGALDGTQNSSFAKFMLTNNNPEDYKDKVEVENTIHGELKSIFDLCSGFKPKESDE